MKAIKYPFRLDTFGKIITTENSNSIYDDRVKSLLSTLIFSRPMNANYGVDMTRGLYESGNDFTTAVGSAITRALSIFMPNVRIEKVKVTPAGSSGEATVDIRLIYPDGTNGLLLVSANELSSDGTNTGDIY